MDLLPMRTAHKTQMQPIVYTPCLFMIIKIDFAVVFFLSSAISI